MSVKVLVKGRVILRRERSDPRSHQKISLAHLYFSEARARGLEPPSPAFRTQCVTFGITVAQWIEDRPTDLGVTGADVSSRGQ